jgi:hypothetical protein
MGTLPIRLAVCCAMMSTPSYAGMLSAFPPEDQQVGLYNEACSLGEAHECVELVVGCESWNFSLIAGVFDNIQISDWLVARRSADYPDDPYQGEAQIVAGGRAFPVHPVEMAYNELNGSWDITITAAYDYPVIELWDQLLMHPEWSIGLGDNKEAFSLNPGAVDEFRKLAEHCRRK